MIQKRCLLWDWTNTAHVPEKMDQVNFSGPLRSVANWNTWVPPELHARAPFRPTVRTTAQLAGQEWANLLSALSSTASPPPPQQQQQQTAIVHFLNEPERAGTSPADAATAWLAQMVPLRNSNGPDDSEGEGPKTETQLVGPSCASDDAGTAWLAEFMENIKDAPPDFLGLHYYGTEAEAATRYVREMHAKYPQLPVVVSEIACVSRTKAEVDDFTAKVANWMDETEWVFEYAFFGCMREVADGFVSPEAQLMDKEGGFTELMVKLMTEQPIKV